MQIFGHPHLTSCSSAFAARGRVVQKGSQSHSDSTHPHEPGLGKTCSATRDCPTHTQLVGGRMEAVMLVVVWRVCRHWGQLLCALGALSPAGESGLKTRGCSAVTLGVSCCVHTADWSMRSALSTRGSLCSSTGQGFF